MGNNFKKYERKNSYARTFGQKRTRAYGVGGLVIIAVMLSVRASLRNCSPVSNIHRSAYSTYIVQNFSSLITMVLQSFTVNRYSFDWKYIDTDIEILSSPRLMEKQVKIEQCKHVKAILDLQGNLKNVQTQVIYLLFYFSGNKV